MATKYPLNNIRAVTGREIFFDANILIYLFWPTGQHRWENSYSSAFADLLRQQNKLFVDFWVISEIINRIHRIEYEKYLVTNSLTKNTFNYKDYRNSADGQNDLKDIYTVVETLILNNFIVAGKIFTKNDIEQFLIVDSLDIMDKAILSVCKENAFVLFTNDKDYKVADIDILTSNPAILNS